MDHRVAYRPPETHGPGEELISDPASADGCVDTSGAHGESEAGFDFVFQGQGLLHTARGTPLGELREGGQAISLSLDKDTDKSARGPRGPFVSGV